MKIIADRKRYDSPPLTRRVPRILSGWRISVLAAMACLSFAAHTARADDFTFHLNGDDHTYYPVFFHDDVWDRGEFVINIHRANVHTDGNWQGSLVARFWVHETDWGHGSQYLNYDVHVNGGQNNVPHIADAELCNIAQGFVVWLRGAATYYYTCDHQVSQMVENSSGNGTITVTQSPVPIETYTAKTAVDPSFRIIGMTLSGGLTVKQDSNFEGNVGIGTTNPTHKLEVNGTIRAKEVVVEANNWPDYIFAKGAPQPSLAAWQASIESDGHLPGMPSKATAEKDGVSVGEMQKALLEKVEQLSLLLIEEHKHNEAALAKQNRAIADLRAENARYHQENKALADALSAFNAHLPDDSK